MCNTALFVGAVLCACNTFGRPQVFLHPEHAYTVVAARYNFRGRGVVGGAADMYSNYYATYDETFGILNRMRDL
jgi:hypothetical protein